MTDKELLLERLEWLAIVLDELMPQCAELVRDAVTLLKEQEPKLIIHEHEEFSEHDWKRNDDGTIDDFAMEDGYHNGPMCTRCYYSFCKHCDPDGWNKKPCVIDRYKCPNCKGAVGRKQAFCSQCGQKLKSE